MADKRIIKKYPNRRLYDTAESKYITLEDVRKLVLDGVEFSVVDKKTSEDITRNILLQIIIEQEDGGEPIFTTDVLQQIISFHGNSVQGLAANFLQRSLAMFNQQQETLQKQMNQAVQDNPLGTVTEMTQRNLELWQRMQNDFFNAAGMGSGSKPDKGAGSE